MSRRPPGRQGGGGCRQFAATCSVATAVTMCPPGPPRRGAVGAATASGARLELLRPHAAVAVTLAPQAEGEQLLPGLAPRCTHIPFRFLSPSQPAVRSLASPEGGWKVVCWLHVAVPFKGFCYHFLDFKNMRAVRGGGGGGGGRRPAHCYHVTGHTVDMGVRCWGPERASSHLIYPRAE